MNWNKKPRLAEVLGVEVGEKFGCLWVRRATFHVDKCGELCDEEGLPRATVAVDMINHPEIVQRCPRWTERDVEIAKAIKLLAPAMDYIERIAENRSELYSKLDFGAAYLRIPCIPSMKEGERIALDDIIGGNT